MNFKVLRNKLHIQMKVLRTHANLPKNFLLTEEESKVFNNNESIAKAKFQVAIYKLHNKHNWEQSSHLCLHLKQVLLPITHKYMQISFRETTITYLTRECHPKQNKDLWSRSSLNLLDMTKICWESPMGQNYPIYPMHLMAQ